MRSKRCAMQNHGITLSQYTTVILLQIVMSSPRTHLVKNQESL